MLLGRLAIGLFFVAMPFIAPEAFDGPQFVMLGIGWRSGL